MKKIIAGLHMSLDGYLAGLKGEMDWIRVDEEIFDLAKKLTDEADTALYGRITYDMMQSYWPTAGDEEGASRHDKEHSQWYNAVQKIVISKTLADQAAGTTIIKESIGPALKKFKSESGKNIQVFGSPSICRLLLEQSLLDELWLFVNPVVLGNGIPLFPKMERMGLELQWNKKFTNGVLGLHYNCQVKD